jgi:hypothetical protein
MVTLSVMKVALLAVILFLSSSAALFSQGSARSAPAPSENSPTIKVDAKAQKPPASSVAEYMSVIADLLRSVAWPLVFGLLAITQRGSLRRLLDAVTELVQHSDRIKFDDNDRRRD